MVITADATTGVLKDAGTLASILNASETNTTLALNPTTAILTYTNEDSDNPAIDLKTIEPWYENVNDVGATDNTEDIYSMGNVMIGTNTQATVATAASGSTAAQQLAKFTVDGGDMSVNDLTLGNGGGQIRTNIVFGQNAFENNTTGFSNVALGTSALQNNTTGIRNMAIGFSTLFENTDGGHNTAIGDQVLRNNTSGSHNIGIGQEVLFSNTTGLYNVALGYITLRSNTIGNNNIAIGETSLNQNTTGNNNIALGQEASRFNITGSDNIALGYTALHDNTAGNDNIGIGRGNLYHNEGNRNVSLGYEALNTMTTGDDNTVLGYRAGYSFLSGNQNIIIGASQGLSDLNGSNQLNIGGAIFGTGLTGNVISPAGNIGIGTANPQQKLDVNGKLRVRDLTEADLATDVIITADATTGVLKDAGTLANAITANETITTLDDNGDNTYTYTSEDDTEVTINTTPYVAGNLINITGTTISKINNLQIVSVASSIDVDALNVPEGIFRFDLTSLATMSISDFLNPVDGGVYNFHFLNASGSTVNLPASFVKEDGTALSTLSVATSRIVTFYHYQGVNYTMER